ncbi:hypothetical protein CCYA_CCYA12G3378 [Cyanidiococcus yangmingshanensis]|nr:hypothetical protein CCYA_CCYA12G3378 [Cyanidiococcus yangmingshanensis]
MEAIERLRNQLGKDLVELVRRSADSDDADTLSFLEEMAAVKAVEDAAAPSKDRQNTYMAAVKCSRAAFLPEKTEKESEMAPDKVRYRTSGRRPFVGGNHQVFVREYSNAAAKEVKQIEYEAYPESLPRKECVVAAGDEISSAKPLCHSVPSESAYTRCVSRYGHSRQPLRGSRAVDEIKCAVREPFLKREGLPTSKLHDMKSCKLQRMHYHLNQAAVCRRVAAAINGPSQAQKRYLQESRQHIERATSLENELVQQFLDEPIFADLDLHGLTTRASTKILQGKISAARSWIEHHRDPSFEFRVIVGRGNHSRGRYPRLRKVVTEFLTEHSIRYRLDEREGAILISFEQNDTSYRMHAAR